MPHVSIAKAEGGTPRTKGRHRRFDAGEMYVRTQLHDDRPLALHGEAEDLVCRYEATVSRVLSRPSGAFTRTRVGRIRFERVAVSAWDGDGWSLHFDFADSLSGDLAVVFDALFDEDGELREELKLMGVGDVLYIESIDVEPGENAFEVVRYSLEHILGRFSHGCLGAVYYQASWESIGVVRPLKDRGFRPAPQNRNVWIADLEMRRPELK